VATQLLAAEVKPHCPSPDIPTTQPATVDVAAILSSLAKIKTVEGERAFDLGEPAMAEIRASFNSGQVKTKMEQFYAMLFIIQDHSPLTSGIMHTVPGQELLTPLVLSGVFPDDRLPKQIDQLKFRRSSLTPLFEVHFKQPQVTLDLNRGKGFRTWQHGLCQEAKSLVFQSPFKFCLKRLENGNLLVYNFQNVDIQGVFGTRGVVDVDLNFVDLLSVEFIRGSPLGYVKAKVSPREFEVNNHSFFLKLITSFFSDTTKQAIDW